MRPGVFLSFFSAARGFDSIDRTAGLGRRAEAEHSSGTRSPGWVGRLLFCAAFPCGDETGADGDGTFEKWGARGKATAAAEPGRAGPWWRVRTHERAQGGEVSARFGLVGRIFGGTCVPCVVAPPAWQSGWAAVGTSRRPRGPLPGEEPIKRGGSPAAGRAPSLEQQP